MLHFPRAAWTSDSSHPANASPHIRMLLWQARESRALDSEQLGLAMSATKGENGAKVITLLPGNGQ